MKIAKHRRTWGIALVILLVVVPATLADYQDGMNFYKARKYAESAAEFQAIVDTSPEYGFGYYMLGLSFLQMKKYKEATTSLEKAVAIDGQKFSYGLAQAQVQHAQGKNLETLKTLNAIESEIVDAAKYNFYSLRGYANADLKKWADAVEDLEKARAAKKTASVNTYLGRAYYKLGYYDKAAPILRDAVDAPPKNADTYLILTESLLNLARETRDESQKQALYVEASQRAEKYRSMKPKDYLAVNLVGKAALGAGDFGKAEEAFLKVLEMKPDYCYAMVNLSKGYLAQERWKSAENILEQAAKCAPRMAIVYDSLGFALQKQGRLEDAKKAYEKSLEIKDDPGVRGRLEIVVNNIKVREENAAATEEEKKIAEEAAKAEAEYQEQLKKQEEWKKKRDD